jgi:phasin family protein
VAKNAPAKPAAKPARVAKAPAPAKAIKPAKTTKTLSGGAGVPSFKPVSETFAMTDFTAVIQTAFTDAQGKAKAAYEKGTASLTEAGTFAQGNVEAMVESSKIFAEGLQKLGASLVADSKETFEGLTSEVKELTAVKSPADFFKLQSDLMKKYFDTTVAYSSKQSEALMKLTTEATSPLSRRMTLAMDKLKAA